MPLLRGGGAGYTGIGSSSPTPFATPGGQKPSQIGFSGSEIQFAGIFDSNIFDQNIFDTALGPQSTSLSAAITESSDTVAANARLLVSFSAAISESSDVVAANMAAVWSLSASISESSDIVSANLAAVWTVSAAITEGSDTFDASLSVGNTASFSAAITEGSDTFAANLAAITSLSAAITEGSDTVSGTLGLVQSLSAAITESSDTFAANLGLVQRLSAAITEGSDVVSAAVTVAAGTTTLSAAITEGSDTVSVVLSTPNTQPVQGGGPGWKGPKEPEYRIHPEYADRPKKKRKVTEPETIVLAPDLEVQTGIVPVRPAWDVMAELQQRADQAEQARREKLRQIALADDEWLMVA